MPSNVIRAFDYDSQRNELTVTFVSGRVYVYSLVPPAAVEQMRAAFSKGGFFNREIRDRYPVREVAAGEAATPASGRSAWRSDGNRHRG